MFIEFLTGIFNIWPLAPRHQSQDYSRTVQHGRRLDLQHPTKQGRHSESSESDFKKPDRRFLLLESVSWNHASAAGKLPAAKAGPSRNHSGTIQEPPRNHSGTTQEPTQALIQLRNKS